MQSVQKTAARLVSETIFRDQEHYFTALRLAATLAFGVVQNRFQVHVQSCLYLYKLYIPVKNFGGRPWLRASAGYPRGERPYPD